MNAGFNFYGLSHLILEPNFVGIIKYSYIFIAIINSLKLILRYVVPLAKKLSRRLVSSDISVTGTT